MDNKLTRRRALLLACSIIVFFAFFTFMPAGAQVNAHGAPGAHKPGGGALIRAIKAGDLDKVRLLLRRGANPNARDRHGRWAILFVTNTMVSRLYGDGHGGGVNITHYKNHEKIVELLVKYGAKVNVADRNGETPLLQAQLSDERDLVAFLKKKGAVK